MSFNAQSRKNRALSPVSNAEITQMLAVASYCVVGFPKKQGHWPVIFAQHAGLFG